MYLTYPLQTRPMMHANLQQFISLERMKFLYGSLGSQPLSTIRRGLTAGCLDSFPDLTTQNVSKLSPSEITIFGHLDTKRKNYQSTKLAPPDDEWTQVLKSNV